ncbi:MAG: hypothetical protein HC853_15265 [Anaerolineae bacterium]|nr:hypothetical protein [Anaerolineae bacterium]
MAKIQIVVWDAVGNVMWGVPEWDSRPEAMRAQMIEEDGGDEAQARQHAPSWAQLFAGHDVQLTHVASAAELEAVIAEADYLIAHKVNVPAEIMRQGRKLRLVQHLGFDDRGIPRDALREMGVRAAATPLINYFAVAEHCWALILNHLKKMAAQRAGMYSRAYLERSWGTFRGLQLACDQTLGLLGFGEIARPMARIARAFNMRVRYWDIVRFEKLEADYGVEYVSWERLFGDSDIVSVHLALNDKTHGLIGAKEIDAMKRGALFLNTARGKLVNQPALVQAISEKRIAAALDVFAVEPLPTDDPLHALHQDLSHNLTLTAHTAWQSPWTHVRDSLVIWHNVLRDLRGEPVLYLV